MINTQLRLTGRIDIYSTEDIAGILLKLSARGKENSVKIMSSNGCRKR